MATQSPHSPSDVAMRDRANSTASDVVMSDTMDPESPTTDPSTYADAQQVLTPQISNEEQFMSLPKSVANSPLFRLPKDIRVRIYNYCLSSKYSVMWPVDRLNLELQPQLLRTCSTIYKEAVAILYSNTLHFIHPSDANMFLWAHNPDLGRSVTKLLFQIRDRDVKAIWSGYLSSTRVERSLQKDYPNLRTLHIQFRSSFLNAMNGNIAGRFERWENDNTFREVLLGLTDRVPPNCEVKILVCNRLIADDARALYNTFPHQLDRVKDPGPDRRLILRTPWKNLFGASVALEIEGQEQSRYFGP
ncbi:uncharacterized protein PV09_08660 [Verruconis gallopava]|uniref:F-box domain-containing protein n=1 Tax=Verruconis gallopava TaxID=253628 RepID=A0A0D2AL02_9PEZI|nr:uncharacterized protein PV09_08660 [Verruconis gallopava]KIV99733.1 hypothetical protein PV09_08660 [Verruconis gallopava]